MDLVQAEAVCDLIHAGSERAAAAALEQLEGSLSRAFNTLYDELMTVAADLEATLDFTEAELPEETLPELADRTAQHLDRLDRLLTTWNEGRLLREGARVLILGRPNAGKSTLLNALLGYARAIVTDVPGTTRDTLEETLVLDGIPLRIVDTAGLRITECSIEQEGIRRAEALHREADVVLYVIDASQPLHPEDADRLKTLRPECTVAVLNKMDRVSGDPPDVPELLPVQANLRDGYGIEQIKAELARKLENGTDMHTPAHAVISERHRNLLVRARKELREGLTLLKAGDEAGTVMVAAHLREALEQLGEATGRVYHAHLLDAVFSRFCIGK
jgi:tRNA modification GTPase